MSKERMRFTLKAYDHRLLDYVCGKIIETVKRTGGKVVGPVPLPTKVEKITILRAVEALKHLDLPSGVELKGKVA